MDPQKTKKLKFSQIVGLVLLALFLLSAALIALGYYLLPSIAETRLIQLLEDKGFDSPQLKIKHLGTTRLEASELQLAHRGWALELANASLHYDRESLESHQVKTLTAEGLEASLELSELLQDTQHAPTQLTLGGATALLNILPQLPTRELVVPNAKLLLNHQADELPLDLSLFLEAEDTQTFLAILNSPTDHIALNADLNPQEETDDFSLQFESQNITAWHQLLSPLLKAPITAITAEHTNVDLAFTRSKQVIYRWLTLLNTRQVSITTEDQKIDADELNLSLQGKRNSPVQYWLNAQNLTIENEDLLLSVQTLSTEFSWQEEAMNISQAEINGLTIQQQNTTITGLHGKLADLRATSERSPQTLTYSNLKTPKNDFGPGTCNASLYVKDKKTFIRIDNFSTPGLKNLTVSIPL